MRILGALLTNVSNDAMNEEILEGGGAPRQARLEAVENCDALN